MFMYVGILLNGIQSNGLITVFSCFRYTFKEKIVRQILIVLVLLWIFVIEQKELVWLQIVCLLK